MANEDQVSKLRDKAFSAKEWNEWRESHDAKLDLSRALLRGANLNGHDLTGADFTDADLHGVTFHHAELVSANFNKADLEHAKFDNANLTKASVRAHLAHAQFTRANLAGADLRGASVNSDTSFVNAIVAECKVDRFTLECLDDYGGLTKGQRMSMSVVDGVATLRAAYSGFWQWVHLTALAGFLFPYVWFVLWNWMTRATFASGLAERRIALWEALARYIWNGGVDWKLGWQFHWSFFLFVVALSYNVLRLALLYKTKQLELQQESSGLPAKFSLQASRWGKALRIANVVLWINLGAVTLNTIHFMTQTIPVD